jgi:hypothetical protein
MSRCLHKLHWLWSLAWVLNTTPSHQHPYIPTHSSHNENKLQHIYSIYYHKLRYLSLEYFPLCHLNPVDSNMTSWLFLKWFCVLVRLIYWWILDPDTWWLWVRGVASLASLMWRVFSYVCMSGWCLTTNTWAQPHILAAECHLEVRQRIPGRWWGFWSATRGSNSTRRCSCSSTTASYHAQLSFRLSASRNRKTHGTVYLALKPPHM